MDSLQIKLNTYYGAIAMIDILGYADRLYKSSIEEIKVKIIDKIISLIEAANTVVNRDRYRFNKFSNNNTIHTTSLDYLFFSDSMLLFIETDDASLVNIPEHTINSLCYATSLILGKGFENNIALRGAISFGEFYIQRDPVIIIGRPIFEISRLEKSQNWAGIVLSEELNKFDLIESFITKYFVPFKNEKDSKEMNVINWTRYINKPDFDLCFNSKRTDVLVKKENTLKFYNYMIDHLKTTL